ncbi:MAG: MBL fold metallo-hydrolase [Candidatus Aminicenantes bacterium]|nr:MBL fold metallo-hydrolase [Candidatus Aminicenantes bacterium]
MKYKIIVVGALETNCYLVYCEDTRACAVVDPGAEHERIFPVIFEEGLTPIVLINTHGHIDHIGANKDIKEHFGVPLYIHAGDNPMLGKVQQLELSLFLEAKDSPPADHLMTDGEEIRIGNGSLRVLHTPGHSPGSVSLLGDGFLLSGDTLFMEGVGRTDLPGGSQKQLEQSIREKIMTLPDETVVLPGHGPHTTVGQERADNSFLT